MAETLAQFDEVIGLEDLVCLHLNDAKHARGSHTDRHTHIGEGTIGDPDLAALITHPAIWDCPVILETPTEDDRGFVWHTHRVRELRDG